MTLQDDRLHSGIARGDCNLKVISHPRKEIRIRVAVQVDRTVHPDQRSAELPFLVHETRTLRARRLVHDSPYRHFRPGSNCTWSVGNSGGTMNWADSLDCVRRLPVTTEILRTC